MVGSHSLRLEHSASLPERFSKAKHVGRTRAIRDHVIRIFKFGEVELARCVAWR